MKFSTSSKQPDALWKGSRVRAGANYLEGWLHSLECGKPGYTKSKCPDCNPSKGDPAHFGILKVSSLSPANRNAVLRISINGVSPGTAFAIVVQVIQLQEQLFILSFSQQGAAFEKHAHISILAVYPCYPEGSSYVPSNRSHWKA
ncbi:hypothetical protein TNIN_62531 [Trichonephila inaurata madagascariensis]|uniref:Uncharacterized protein n=1 Tax=Trichonephila inaurata madagascariensis TaxID=2747483 RepID=A0A8X6XMJ4_9ARAC|nr:hypothetical protein TNIN_62531 [Trichonephila inaurata madagascariensis]